MRPSCAAPGMSGWKLWLSMQCCVARPTRRCCHVRRPWVGTPPGGVVVIVGPAPQLEPAQALESIRHIAAIAGSDMLGAVQGDRMVVVLGGDRLNSPDHAAEVVRKFVTMFGPGAVVVGPTVEHLMDAATSTREAVSAYRAAAGWPEAPRPVTSHDLLPERALSGDGHARRALAHDIYEPLQAAGRRLLETLVTFLDQGSRWKQRRAHCSSTPTPCATDCAESMRSPATAPLTHAMRTLCG